MNSVFLRRLPLALDRQRNLKHCRFSWNGNGIDCRLYATDPNEKKRCRYDEIYRKSQEKPREFWEEQAHHIVWTKMWDRVIDESDMPFTKWFVGGRMNTCYNAVDRHVDEGRGSQVAIIHESPLTNTVKHITYKELQHEVSHLAGVLSKLGVGIGDHVLIYMPMVREAVYAMLATVRLGAVHSLVFGGFAANQLATRINHAEPKVVISANCGIEPGRVVDYKPLLDRAIEQSQFKPPTCLILQRKSHPQFTPAKLIPGRDLEYEELMAAAKPHDCVDIEATEALYTLYTSGTTGEPKAVVRPSGGHAVVLRWSMEALYGIKPGETWFAASDLGWIVGHSYIVYGPLMAGNTTIVYEGKPVGTPDPSSYYRLISQHNVAGMFTAPTALRALRKEDEHGIYKQDYDLSNLRTIFVAGEHCDKETLEWTRERFGVPTLDNWWQTETGSAITATCVGLTNKLDPPPGTAGKPVPHWDLKIVRDDGTECEPYELGQIIAKLPLPPSAFSTLYKNPERYKQTYFSRFEGYYDTMDAGYRDKEGHIAVMSRTDDVINVAGHRLTSGQMEEACSFHDEVLEAAVVGLPDTIKGHVPLAFCVLSHDKPIDKNELKMEVNKIVRERVGAIATLKDCLFVRKLPKTRSGKVARNTLAAMIQGQPYKMPVTIEDTNVYDDIREVAKQAGYNHAAPEQ